MIRTTLLTLALATGCNPATQSTAHVPGIVDGGTSIANVNGIDVTQEMLDLTIASLPPQLRMQLEATGQIGQLGEQMVVTEALYQKAINEGMHNNDDIQLKLAMASKTALADAWVTKTVEARITDAAIKTWYEEHLVQFAQAQVNARIIVAKDAPSGAVVKGLLDGGGDFAEVAKVHSQDPNTSSKGGDLGWMTKEDLRGPFAEPVFAGETGSVVGPIDAGGPQLFFKIEDKRDSVPLSDVTDEIKASLSKDLAETVVKEVREGAKVTWAGKDEKGEAKADATDDATGEAKADATDEAKADATDEAKAAE
jgi:peptidyl-prolyl cis-trans isomerase C